MNKLRNYLVNTLLLLFTLTLFGCGAIKYTDISNDENYKYLVGQKYRLIQTMVVTGVNLPPGYGTEINIYFLESYPINWAGSELISEDLIKPATIIKVLNIQKGNWRNGIKVTVDIVGFTKKTDVDIFLKLELLKEGRFLKDI